MHTAKNTRFNRKNEKRIGNLLNNFSWRYEKVKYISKLYDKTPEKAKDIIVKTDKKRSNYYNYYTRIGYAAILNNLS